MSNPDVTPGPGESTHPQARAMRIAVVIGLVVFLLGTAAVAWLLRHRFFPKPPAPPMASSTDPWAGKLSQRHFEAVRYDLPRPVVAGQELPPIALDGSTLVPVDFEFVVTAHQKLPELRLDPSSFTSQSVGLLRARDRSSHPIAVSVDADRRTVRVRPSVSMLPGENYVLQFTTAVEDEQGNPLQAPQFSIFTTPADDLSGIAFTRHPQPPGNDGVTHMAFGPDGRFYASTDEGLILRYDVADDGSLVNELRIDTLQRHAKAGMTESAARALRRHYGFAEDGSKDNRTMRGHLAGMRLLMGFAFDPKSTPDDLTLYASHTPLDIENAPDASATVTRLSGPELGTATDVLIHLPRSMRDHQTFAPIFGPDGALYFHQGAQNSSGMPDEIWGYRPSSRLTSSVLRLDLAKWDGTTPIDTRTPDAGGTYDATAADAPLTVYATGIRVAYNLLWHSNGQLYAAINGSSAGGATPARGEVPAIEHVDFTEHDWFMHVRQGRYYGHPNPIQGYAVLNGGNPTAGPDWQEVYQYPIGTPPEPTFDAAALNLGTRVSANGMTEYKADTFGGRMRGMIAVCRYNKGADLLWIGVGADGNVQRVWSDIPGTTKLQNPLAVLADPVRGNLYVSEYGARRITLLRPAAATTAATTQPEQ